MLKGKTVIITGASRGIGQAIALRYAAAKANIVILSKDSPTNIKETANEIVAAGGQVLALNIDVSDYNALRQAAAQTVVQFGGVDILVNNTSATCLTDILHTTPEQFDLVLATSARAAFFLSQACQPHLQKASNPHIINISPPLSIDPFWFKNHLAFSIGKYAMSMCTLGMAEQFKQDKIAVNSLWPKTTIATQTIKDHFLPKVHASSRWPSIMADAAYELSLRNFQQYSGLFLLDEDFLREIGRTIFSQYAVDPTSTLMQSFFLPVEDLRNRVPQDLFVLNQPK